MSRRMYTLLASVALLVASCEGNPEPPKAPTSAARKAAAPAPIPKTTDWIPEPSLLGELAAETKMLGNADCSILASRGLSVAAPGHATGFRRRGCAMGQSTSTRRHCACATGHHRQAATRRSRPSFGGIRRWFLEIRSSQLGPLQMQPVEYGRINGLSFARVRWSAKTRLRGQQTHGLAYVATPGQSDIMIDMQDIEPHQASTLKVADAAARTFRFRGAGR